MLDGLDDLASEMGRVGVDPGDMVVLSSVNQAESGLGGVPGFGPRVRGDAAFWTVSCRRGDAEASLRRRGTVRNVATPRSRMA